ncbi:hypothetical protein [Rahnella sp. R3(2024)]|uniref:hypothetical protein n=1 Tax=Rahnella sp. R3(2024) TaxID=3163550 RepID=UPI0036F10C6E
MKHLMTALILCAPLATTAYASSVTPQTLHDSVKKIGAAQAISHLNEQEFQTLTSGITKADPEWLKLVPEIAPGIEGGNASTLVEALARALSKDPKNVISALSDPASASLPGKEKVCTLPFPGEADASLARYYRLTEPALKKMGEKGKSCLNELHEAFGKIRTSAQDQQNFSLNRRKITPALLWSAMEKDGAEKVASSLSVASRKTLQDGISQGDREWLMIADALVNVTDPQTHAMLMPALATALSQNPGDVLKVAEGNIETDILCAMPFPDASTSALSAYYQKTQTALLRLHRRGENCLKVLQRENELMVNKSR